MRRVLVIAVMVLVAAVVPVVAGSIDGAVSAQAAPPCRRAWANNLESSSIAMVDLDAGALGPSIAVPDRPFRIAVTPDSRTAVVTSETGSSVTVVDLVSGAVGPSLTLPFVPAAVAITPDGSQAVVVGGGSPSGSMVSLDLATGTLGTAVAGVSGVDVAITPDGSQAVVVAATGVVLVDLATDAAGPLIPIAGSYRVAIAADGQTAWVTTPFDPTGLLQPVALATGTLLPPIALGVPPLAVGLIEDGGTALVTTVSTGELLTVDLVAGTIVARQDLPDGPNGPQGGQVAVAPDGGLALVVDNGDNRIFPVTLPAVTIGTAIAGGPYVAPTVRTTVAFGEQCPPPFDPPGPPTTTTTTTRPVVAAEAVRATPNFTG